MNRIACFAVLVGFCAGCEPDTPNADYSDHDRFEGEVPFIQGERSFDPAVRRLGLRQFGYEGAQSESVLAGFLEVQTIRSFFIFDTNNDGTGIFLLDESTSTNRVEGKESVEFVHAGLSGGGAGYFDYQGRDFSDFSVFHVALFSTGESLTDISFRFVSGEPSFESNPDDGSTFTGEGTFRAADFGYVNNGVWHNLTIPLQVLTDQGMDFAQFRNLIVSVGPASAGESFLIDDAYFEAAR